jgi:xanthine dehydrogenase accessory factor/xanthine dehydrogenase large subunit
MTFAAEQAMEQIARPLETLLLQGEPAILVEVATTKGSVPREAGARMLVARQSCHGTIGGGQLEFHAIDVARGMLAAGEAEKRLKIPLGPHLGQCCGGHVTLRFARAAQPMLADLAAREARERADLPRLRIFGAGHTGRALARLAALLPYDTWLIDERAETLAGVPDNVHVVCPDDAAAEIDPAPPRAAFVILTHSHALDYRLADAALRRGDAAYVGMIGSATKRALFERSFVDQGGDPKLLGRFTCPIGGTRIRDKRPELIALAVAAELAEIFCSAS